MFGISRLINLIVTLILTLLFTITLLGTIATYSTVKIISDRENVRSWMKEDDVNESYVNYIVEKTYSANVGILIRGVISEEDYADVVRKGITDKTADQIIDSTVDQTYDWLEGNRKIEDISFSPINEETDFSILDDLLDEKLGFIAEYLDVADILLFSDRIELINLEAFSLGNVPDLYQGLLSLPRKLGIVSIILAVVIFLSNKSWRSGLLMLGLATTAVALLILIGKDYISINYLLSKYNLPFGISELPDIKTLPEFIQLIGLHGEAQIGETLKGYGLYTLGIGIVAIALSQLAITEKTVEVEEEADEDEDDPAE